jgi:hypothetical protein
MIASHKSEREKTQIAAAYTTYTIIIIFIKIY